MTPRTQMGFETDADIEQRKLSNFRVQLPQVGESGYITHLGQDHEYRLQKQGRLELIPQPKETSRDVRNEASDEAAGTRGGRNIRVRWLAGLEA